MKMTSVYSQPATRTRVLVATTVSVDVLVAAPTHELDFLQSGISSSLRIDGIDIMLATNGETGAYLYEDTTKRSDIAH